MRSWTVSANPTTYNATATALASAKMMPMAPPVQTGSQHSTPQHITAHHSTSHHTTPHHTTPHHSTSHHTTPHHTIPYHTTPQHITPHHTTPHHTTPHHTTPHHSTTHHSTLHHTLSHHITQAHTKLRSKVAGYEVVSPSPFDLPIGGDGRHGQCGEDGHHHGQENNERR